VSSMKEVTRPRFQHPSFDREATYIPESIDVNITKLSTHRDRSDVDDTDDKLKTFFVTVHTLSNLKRLNMVGLSFAWQDELLC
jgi:hypothetical protein